MLLVHNTKIKMTTTKLIELRYAIMLNICAWIAISGLCSAQTWQRVSTNRNAVSCLDEKNIVSVGQYGVIMKSEDAGATWQYTPSGTTQSLLDVYFLNNQRGIAIGESGILLRTNDGGNKWEIDSFLTDLSLFAMKFHNELQGIAVGDSGTIFLTEDGGKSWNKAQSGTKNALYGIAYSDSQTVMAVGALGTIIQSIDGGKSWNTIDKGITSSLYDIAFNQNNGIIVGYKIGPSRSGTILLSSDKGKTWQEAEAANLNIYPETVLMIDTNRVIAAGNYPMLDTFATKIIISNNGGKDWQEIRNGYTRLYYSLRDIEAINGNTLIVGEGCSILFSNDSGSSWAERSQARQFSHQDLPNANIRFSEWHSMRRE